MSLNPYEPASPAYEWRATPIERKHSGLGIASFVMSILVGLGMFCLIAWIAVLAASSGQTLKEDSSQAIAIGLGIFAFLFLDLIAFLLGIVGLCQPNRQKVFAILGLLFSFTVAAGMIGLIAVGLSMKK
jgi:hypothetical protein